MTGTVIGLARCNGAALLHLDDGGHGPTCNDCTVCVAERDARSGHLVLVRLGDVVRRHGQAVEMLCGDDPGAVLPVLE